MSPHDRKRFAKLICDFVAGCGFAAPFHLVVIDSRGMVSVSRYGDAGVVPVCSGPQGNKLRMLPPITVTAISSDGVGKSAKIQVVVPAERVTLQ
jgi:hypothetical protein